MPMSDAHEEWKCCGTCRHVKVYVDGEMFCGNAESGREGHEVLTGDCGCGFWEKGGEP